MRIPIEIVNNHPAFRVAEAPVRRLAETVAADEELTAEALNIVFVTDDYLQALHNRFLSDDTPTDIITFNLNAGEPVDGELYISIDRALAHAGQFSVSADEEIRRLVIHGILHLKGYDDQAETARREMREREDHYLNQFREQFVVLEKID